MRQTQLDIGRVIVSILAKKYRHLKSPELVTP